MGNVIEHNGKRHNVEVTLKPTFQELSTDEALLNGVREMASEKSENNLFVVKSANDWIDSVKDEPIPNMLFDEFWFEGELCILFADTNQGKSVLATQVADSITRGIPIEGFKMDAEPQEVIYFDFELRPKQFEARCGVKDEQTKTFKQHYRFDDKLLRVELNPNRSIDNGKLAEKQLIDAIETIVVKRHVRTLIIDNISFLKAEIERAKDALPLMRELHRIKTQHKLSILVVAHTPKIDMTKPLTINHLSGSKMISNFCDSSFCIGESRKGKHVKYFKQVKVRHTHFSYSESNVAVLEQVKPSNFVHFKFLEFDHEQNHLRLKTDWRSDSRIVRAIEMKKQGKTNAQIGEVFGVKEAAVRKWLRKVPNEQHG